MADEQAPGGGEGKPCPRLVRYRAMVKVRMERDVFLKVFSAAKLSGAGSASGWMRKVLGEAATREIDRACGRRQKPLGGG
jgi:hypothetical protein